MLYGWKIISLLIMLLLDLKVECVVTFGDFDEETGTSSGYTFDCSVFHTTSTFFFAGFFSDAGLHPKYKTHSRAVWLNWNLELY